jgi:hypothetical protein
MYSPAAKKQQNRHDYNAEYEVLLLRPHTGIIAITREIPHTAPAIS